MTTALQYQAQLANLSRSKAPADFYDTDCGCKATIAKMVAKSPHRFAIMQSGTERFKEARSRDATPFGVYNVDAAHRKDLTSSVRDSRRFIAAAFDRASLDKVYRPVSSAVDAVYDADKLVDGMPATIAGSIADSPIHCAIMRSKQAKAAQGVSTAAPDVEYNADKLHKATLVTAMRDSPILYGNMRHSRTQRSGLGHSTACSADVGPGTYNAVMQKDVRTSLLLPTNPLSSMASTGPRLANDKVDPTRWLGSTWKQEHDDKHWTSKGTHMSHAEYLRPQYMPASYAKKP